ncbi:hypothetical protein [Paraburkholderia terricola]|uniref:hypothetical protein n=1 Tax=Paraburkholderia terricola TaxID=169427 RepID=UPI000DEFFCFA|nr:hypothetical protein [Paraburkholderia terricola]AXE96123.1 hypothetical protein CUJ90_28280 [Paraburkholderia terricola]
MDEPGLEVWRIADTLSLASAAALMCGESPARIAPPGESGIDRYHLRRSEAPDAERRDDGPEKFEARLEALTLAAERGTLKAEKLYFGKCIHVRYDGTESVEHWEPVGTIDPGATTVDVDDLKTWLTSRGITSGFFFPVATGTPDMPGYLDPNHPRHSYKLAAGIYAWEAVTDPGPLSPKQALDKWLREHAAKFGLADGGGNPVKQTIEDISKVVNWSPGGGVPKAPGP